MRRLALVLALSLVALPAVAARYVGTWYPGDNVRLLRIDVRDDSRVPWGTSVGLGYTPELEVRRPSDTTLVATLYGAWQDSTDTAALFTIGAASVLAPSQTVPATHNLYADYEATLVLTNGGSVARFWADGNSTPFGFRMQAWP